MPGLDVDRMSQSTPLDCLKTILTDDVFDYLMVSIKAYAEVLCRKNTSARKRPVYGEWKSINNYMNFTIFLLSSLAWDLTPSKISRIFIGLWKKYSTVNFNISCFQGTDLNISTTPYYTVQTQPQKTK